MKTLHYDTMTLEDLTFDAVETIQVMKDGLDFYFRTHFKTDNDELVIFSNGAYDPSKSQLPTFNRYSWSEDIQANCLFVDDRSLHDNGLETGLGVGTPDRHYLQDYSAIALKFRALLNLDSAHTIYFGSSAGGYMSLLLASLDTGSMALVNNPQTYVLRYHESAVMKMLERLLGTDDKVEANKQYGERLSATAFFKKYGVPNIYYMQNLECKSDVDNHFTPFVANLRKYKMAMSSIKYLMYHNKQQGHNPLGKEDTLKILNETIQKKMPL